MKSLKQFFSRLKPPIGGKKVHKQVQPKPRSKKFKSLTTITKILGVFLLIISITIGLFWFLNSSRTNLNQASASAFDAQGDIIGFGHGNTNYNPHLGLGSDVTDKLWPINAPRNINNVVKVDSGYAHGIALTKDGTIFTWGDGAYGQSGIGTTVDNNIPVAIPSVTDAIDIASSQYAVGAVTAKGEAYVWGSSWGSSSIPIRISGINRAKQIEGDSYYNPSSGVVFMILNTDGTVSYASVGSSVATNNYCGIVNAVDVAFVAGAVYTLRADGTLLSGCSLALSGVTEVFGAGDTVFATMNDGTVRACGSNTNGKMGTNNVTTCFGASTVVQGITNPIDIAGYGNHTIFINGDGYVYGAGRQVYGTLGNGIASDTSVATPIRIYPLSSAISAGAGPHTSFVVQSNEGTPAFSVAGEIMGHGYNASGYHLGINSTSNITSPRRVANEAANVIKLRTGHAHALALRADGSVYVWGADSYGQLGMDVYQTRNEPIINPNLNNIVDIATNYETSAAVTNDGNVYLWGRYLANPTVPTLVNHPEIYDIVAIEGDSSASGSPYFQVLRADGKLFNLTSLTAAQLLVSNVVDFAATTNISSYYYWINGNGQLYSGGTLIGSGYKAVFTGNYSTTYAVKNNGTVYACNGGDTSGRLGTSGVGASCTTTIVPNITNPIDISGAVSTMIFINEDGSVWHSGDNSNYTGGDPNSTTNRSVPTKIIPSSSAISAAVMFATGNAVMYVQADGNALNLAKPDPVNPEQPINTGIIITWHNEKQRQSQKSQFFS